MSEIEKPLQAFVQKEASWNTYHPSSISTPTQPFTPHLAKKFHPTLYLIYVNTCRSRSSLKCRPLSAPVHTSRESSHPQHHWRWVCYQSAPQRCLNLQRQDHRRCKLCIWSPGSFPLCCWQLEFGGLVGPLLWGPHLLAHSRLYTLQQLSFFN